MIKRFNIILLLTFAVIIEHVLSQSEKSTCKIPRETQYLYDNFTNLSNSDLTIPGQTAEETIRIRLCSPLMKKCGDKEGYSVCLSKDGKEIGIGKYPGELKNVQHSFLFNFTGDVCEPEKNYNVSIIMKCDYSVTGSSVPQIVPHGGDPCMVHMFWRTNYACVERTATNCSIVDKNNNLFDLSPLTTFSDNHIVPLDNNGIAKMIINVCHSVIHEAGANCPITAGACLANSSNVDIPFLNFGDVNVQKNPLVIENDILKLKYREGGGMCHHSTSESENMETTISFVCDPAAIIDTEPKLSNKSDPCHYQFTWNTAAACPENKKCRVFTSDTRNKYEFNLQPLMNKDFTVNSSQNLQYKFRICGPLLDGECAGGTGICHTKNAASAGKANFNLMWEHGGPYLNYTDGADCGNGLKRHTVIAFVCGAKGSPSVPIIIKDEPCSLIIYWSTDLACDKNITCGQNQTNLIPLIRNDKNYVINAAGTEFHINICRPVVPTPDLVCPHGSAACGTVKDPKGHTKEISLGFPDQNPVPDGNQNLILKYDKGSRCPEDAGKNISSSFKFFCDFKADVGLPEYKSYSQCHYVFEWKTNIVCGAVVGNWSSPCTITDPSHPNELNLSSLYEKPIPRFVTTKDKNYSINICGGKDHCDGSAVCEGANGYGTFSHVTFDYISKLITLQYSNGTKCSTVSKSYASELSLICNRTAGIGDPVLKLDANCTAIFEWQTSIACPHGRNNVIIPDSLNTTAETSIDKLNDYSSIEIWVVTSMLILVVLVVGMWLYLRNPQRCSHLRSRIGAIKANKNQSRVQYSRVNTTEEARLLLDASDLCTDGHIDSDDELLGV